MTLLDVTQMFSSDEQCRELLKRLRWPEGVRCPRCQADAIKLATQKNCSFARSCVYQFSVLAGTIFNDSHLPLPIWFMATLLLCEAKKGMSAMQLKRTIWGQHKGSYKTAWYLCHRIRAAMKEVDQPMLDGTIEMDETYVGGTQARSRCQGCDESQRNCDRHSQARRRSAILPRYDARQERSPNTSEKTSVRTLK